jgi:hypothetical protein
MEKCLTGVGGRWKWWLQKNIVRGSFKNLNTLISKRMKKKNANIETKKYTYHLLILSLRYFIKQIKFKKKKKKIVIIIWTIFIIVIVI